jgi:hypothetical protein
MACFRLLTLPPFPPGRFRSAPLIAPHLAFYVAARAGGVSFSLPLSFLHIDEVHLSPNRFSHKKLRNVCPSARAGIQ